MGYEWRAVCKKGVRTQLFRNPLIPDAFDFFLMHIKTSSPHKFVSTKRKQKELIVGRKQENQEEYCEL